MAALFAESDDKNTPAVSAQGRNGARGVQGSMEVRIDGPFAQGVLGVIDPFFEQRAGVLGQSDQIGVFGIAISEATLGDPITPVVGTGVYGNSQSGHGVRGETQNGTAVQGTRFDSGAFGFLGGSDPKFGQDAGVFGQSKRQGVIGISSDDAGTGVYGFSEGEGADRGFGVRGETNNGIGVQGRSFAGGLAGKFVGNVEVDGNITLVSPGDVILADCAEDFELASGLPDAGPGSVMVLDRTGAVQPCSEPYDKCVVGVVSGAGSYRPAIVLNRGETQVERLPISLVGKVFCLVDATFGAIEVGDMLTTSSTPGHAMKAADPNKTYGAVIGKALGRFSEGKGLIPILVALQ
jgi:hypothetical protein